MSKHIAEIVAVITGMVLLAGCQKETLNDRTSAVTPQDGVSAEVSMEAEMLEELKNAEVDNTLDAYMAVAKASLRIAVDDKANGEMALGQMGSALGNSKGIYFAKHLYDPIEKCWDEIRYATEAGEEISKRFELPENAELTPWSIGSIWGSDDFLAFIVNRSSGKREFAFLELDEELKTKKRIPADFFIQEEFRYEAALCCKKDAAGRIHAVTNFLNTREGAGLDYWRYYVMDENGNKLFEWHEDSLGEPRLIFDTGGRVILQASTYHLGELNESDKHVLYAWDERDGDLKVLSEFPMSEENRYWFYGMPEKDVILTANSKGIYRTRDGFEEELYVWGKHGISVSFLDDLVQTPDGRIQVIYVSNGTRWYVSLKETGDKREVTEIELAVSANLKQVCQSSANEFNKRYPAYHVSVKDDYDEKQLLTRLIAGDGPVLIDTSLTGFEGQEKLWMPLDNLFEQLGMDGNLVEKAMTLGEIDGRLYGVVSSFWIETVVTKAKSSGHWDYEEFMKCVREKPIDAVINYDAGDKGLTLFSNLLNHGLADNYFLNVSLGGKSFEDREFRELLEVAEKYFGRNEVKAEDEKLWPEGGVLCNRVSITKPEDLEAYRLFYGEDIYFIGYPSKDGAGHYLNAAAPLTIRDTADIKEKAAALAFIRFLLSEEVQKEASKSKSFFLSVRKDVLSDQIRGMTGGTVIQKYGYPEIKLKDKLDYETDEKKLYELLEQSAPKKYFSKELRDVVFGELGDYFNGNITKETLVDHLKNRVGLYLNENMH